jgi:putative hemolysin
MATELLIIVVCLLGNGVFSGAEIAVLGVRKTLIHELVRRRDRRAIAVERLRAQPERFLATVQICITVFGTAAAAVGGAQFAQTLAPTLEAIGFGTRADEIALALVIAMIVVLGIVIGELVPKSLALRYASGYSLLIARPLLLLARLMRPFVWFLTASSNLVLRLFGDRTTFVESRLSRDELRQLVEEAAKAGSVDPRASEIASRALGFDEVTVAEIMVPRIRISALRRTASVEETQRILLEDGHSRMPVYDGSLDNIVGYVVARDVLALVWEKGLVVLDDILRPPHKVAYSTRAMDCLRELQRTRTQMAIVIDEVGGVAGLVTIEDLVEELVGDIASEDDVPESFLTREPAGTTIVEGWAPVRKVNRDLNLDLPVGKDRTTIAGLCISLAQAIPKAGERLTTDNGTELEIIEASAARVRRVRIHPVERA